MPDTVILQVKVTVSGIQTQLLYSDSLVAQMVKSLPAMPETWVRSLSWEDSPGEGNGDPLHYSCLENPHELYPARLLCPWGHKESYTTELYKTDEPCSELDIFKLLYSLFWNIDKLPGNSLISPALIFLKFSMQYQ